ncbi:CDP-diacylglycerol--serine O-phosphatidyltransferase [candidate division KSB1 bacterium]|nr:CDP-diacylglycerol--serine O-phosphatidyltransferase [candidate division KSB1 bacterium]
MKNTKKVIPNIFTTLNIFCGYLAIISVNDGKILNAAWLITIAAILDVLDGQVARLTKTSSDFGIEFDSLADVISFGVAPAIIIYKVFFEQFGMIGIILSFLPLMCGGIRLARFNVLFGGKEKTNFVGLPIPAAALSFMSFIIFNYHLWDEIYLSRVMIPQLILVSGLMVSKVEYSVLPKATFRHSKKNSIEIILIISSLIILSLFPQKTFYPLMMLYILWGILQFVFKIITNSDHENQIEKKKKK